MGTDRRGIPRSAQRVEGCRPRTARGRRQPVEALQGRSGRVLRRAQRCCIRARRRIRAERSREGRAARCQCEHRSGARTRERPRSASRPAGEVGRDRQGAARPNAGTRSEAPGHRNQGARRGRRRVASHRSGSTCPGRAVQGAGEPVRGAGRQGSGCRQDEGREKALAQAKQWREWAEAAESAVNE